MPAKNNSFITSLRDLFLGASHRTKAYWLINAFMIMFIFIAYGFVDIVDEKQIFLYCFYLAAMSFIIYLFMVLIAALGYKKILLLDPIVKIPIIFFIIYSGAPLLLYSNHPMISPLLHNIDLWLGFSTLHAIAWMFKHPYLVATSAYCYEKWNLTTMIVITIINLRGERNYVEHVLIILQISIIGCASFAYFLPSLTPMHYIQQEVQQLHGYHYFSRFLEFPYQLQEYYNARHHLPIIIGGIFYAGFVSFPSFHTFTMLLLLRICWQRCKVIFIPIVIYSTLVLISVIGLGHHYIADLGGALLLFYFSIELEKELFARNTRMH